MHICLILGNTHPNKKLRLNVGGIANQILLLLPSYENIEDIKISLVTKYTEYKPRSNRIKIHEIHKFHNFLLDTLYFFLKSPLTILKIHKKDPINIINFHNSTYFYSFIILIRLLFKIPILMKIPLDFASFLRDTSMPKENKIRTRILNYSWFKIFKKIILKKINFIRAINKKIYDDLIDLNYPKDRVLEIPNGINSKNFFGLQKNKREISHFGYVGRLVQIKNLKILLYSFKNYFLKYPLDKLFIYGIGPEGDWISKFIKKNNLTGNVILYGFEKNKKKIYSNIDVLIDTSLAQGISNSNLEAMCTDTLVIASNVIGNRDLIKHKSTGLLFNPLKREELLNQLLFFKSNPEIINHIIENAKKEVLTNFDVDVITNKIYNYLRLKLSLFH